ncbi:MAG TPA: nucleotide-binding protein [Clostridiaceae bacterium]|nr:nucleotide-binding protein [Clostridiaceae bacterium]
MKNKHIILFSSGISEEKGILDSLVSTLEVKGYMCSYWRDLFSGANDSDNIAILPMLIKKIPTFDYAILVCEGHDITTIQRQGTLEQVYTMRDNVLFEIGLCVMALGLSKTILVTDALVRKLFVATVKSLLHETFFEQTITENYSLLDPEERKRMQDDVMDVVRNRLTIEYVD